MTSEKILSAEEILGAQDVRYETVEVPEWGGCVRLQSLSGAEMARFLDSSKGDKRKDSAILLLTLSAVDEDGNQIFTSASIAELRKKSLRAFIDLQDHALALNGLSEKVESLKNA